MKEIYIIRHAESISNAGEITKRHDIMPLSEKGRQQAKELAKQLEIKPDLIVISEYSRTKETAEPFMAKHPSVPVETWNQVHEFTQLDPKNYDGTTKEERTAQAIHYWENRDIYFNAGNGAESFKELTHRVTSLVEHLKTRTEKTIVIFSHGRFIIALQLYLRKIKELGHSSLTDDHITELMQIHVRGVKAREEFPIPNVSVHKIEI